jgi:nucleoside-diphosphate-sugar epimerase
MNPTPTVLVTGATSQLGVFLLPRLETEGMDITALSRSVSDGPVQVTEKVRWHHPSNHGPAEFDFLVSCGPLDLAAELVEKNEDLKKAVVFSTTSVFTKPNSADAQEREIISRIAAQENRLKSTCADRGVALVIIRPTLIYGCGMDSNVSLLLRLGEKTGFIPLSRSAAGLRQPVHADDLAQLAVDALKQETGELLEGAACGASTLQFREMAARIAQCGTRKIRLLHLPAPLLSALVRTASLIGPWKGINPEMVRRQSEDMVFDDTTFKNHLHWTPREFKPGPEDFQITPETSKHQVTF